MSWLHRLVLAGLLLTAYLYAWTPARTAWIEQSAILLKRVVDATDADAAVEARTASQTLRVRTDGGAAVGYSAPAGVKFLLPAGLLLLIAPTRPPLGGFFAGHLVLGGLGLVLLASGSIGFPGGFGLARFLQGYAVDAYSLAVPVLISAGHRSTVPDRRPG